MPNGQIFFACHIHSGQKKTTLLLKTLKKKKTFQL